MPNSCVQTANQSGRDLRIVWYSKSAAASSWLVEFGPVLTTADRGWNQYLAWLNKSYPGQVSLQYTATGVSTYFVHNGRDLDVLSAEPTDVDIKVVEISDPQVPQKACQCDDSWWICEIGNELDCDAENPCDGMKILPIASRKAEAGS